MQPRDEHYLWVEKYRPQKVSECILTDALKQTFEDIVKSGEMPNLLLSGGPGCGKTTVAKALCNEMKMDWTIINCSEDGNIDTLRNRIRSFASTMSMTGEKKVVILDEFDYSNPQSMQPALRGFIEEFAQTCRFILTCNQKNRVIQPLHSRCMCIDFHFTKDDKLNIGKKFLSRVKFILDNEGIKYNAEVLAKLILRFAPDFRRLINELQKYKAAGEIDVGILAQVGNVRIEELTAALKTKDFPRLRKWVTDNVDNDPNQIFTQVYNGLEKTVQPADLPQLGIILAEYQFKAAFVADQELNTAACLTQIMANCKFV